jgi:hypothetical protein
VKVNPVSKESRPQAAREQDQQRLGLPHVVFGVSSIAFLAFVAFGTVETRIWRLGRLNFEDRSITHVWGYFGDRLPDLHASGLISALYWVSLAVMVLGTVIGLWLFLGTDDEEPAREHQSHGPESPTTHA